MIARLDFTEVLSPAAAEVIEHANVVASTRFSSDCQLCRMAPALLASQHALLLECRAEIERLGKVAEILPKLLYLQNERIYHGPDSIWAKDNPELAAYLREKQTKENTDGN